MLTRLLEPHATRYDNAYQRLRELFREVVGRLLPLVQIKALGENKNNKQKQQGFDLLFRNPEKSMNERHGRYHPVPVATTPSPAAVGTSGCGRVCARTPV